MFYPRKECKKIENFFDFGGVALQPTVCSEISLRSLCVDSYSNHIEEYKVYLMLSARHFCGPHRRNQEGGCHEEPKSFIMKPIHSSKQSQEFEEKLESTKDSRVSDSQI